MSAIRTAIPYRMAAISLIAFALLITSTGIPGIALKNLGMVSLVKAVYSSTERPTYSKENALAAERAFMQAQRYLPQDSSLSAALAYTWVSLGDHERATQILGSSDAPFGVVEYWSQYIFRVLKSYELAASWYRVITELAPTNAEGWFYLALARHRLGDDLGAQTVVKDAIQQVDRFRGNDPVLILDSAPDEQWHRYWENNSDATLTHRDGYTELSYQNIPQTRQIVAYDFEPRFIITNYKELVLKLKTTSHTFITIDLLIDSRWMRPIAYQQLGSADWHELSLPIRGDLLEDIRLSVSEPTDQMQVEASGYALVLDWIAAQ